MQIRASYGNLWFPSERFFGYSKKQAVKLYREKYGLKYKRIDLFID